MLILRQGQYVKHPLSEPCARVDAKRCGSERYLGPIAIWGMTVCRTVSNRCAPWAPCGVLIVAVGAMTVFLIEQDDG